MFWWVFFSLENASWKRRLWRTEGEMMVANSPSVYHEVSSSTTSGQVAPSWPQLVDRLLLQISGSVYSL